MHFLSFLFDKHLDKTVLAIAVAASIVLLAAGQESKIENAKSITAVLLYPVNKVTGHFQSVDRLESENGELRAMVATLYQERERLVQFGEERNRLRQLLGLKADPFYTFLACEVVARSTGTFFRSVTVDRGSADSARVGMAVIGYRGLVGRISRVYPHSAQVLLLSNKSVSVSCIDRRSRVVGMLEWDRGNVFRLEYVGKEEDIAIGDTVLTSGEGKLFPRGFPVGTVFRISDDRGGISKRVSISSLANLGALEELFIVTKARDWNDTRIYDELEKIEGKRRPGGGQ
jgi:rod shape-determining protein MreC